MTMADVELQQVVVITDPRSIPLVKRDVSGAQVRQYTTGDHSPHLTVADVILSQVFPWHRFTTGTETLRVMQGSCAISVYGEVAEILTEGMIFSVNAGVAFMITPLAESQAITPFVILYAANGPSFSETGVEFLNEADLAKIDAERASTDKPTTPFH